MGTRADFYRGGTDPETMLWLGSIAWDGYPDGIDSTILEATDETTYVETVLAFIASRPDGTHPEQGWPWPWPDSGTTDYAYTWTPEGVRASGFGCPWFAPLAEVEPEHSEKVAFPDMTAIQNTAWDERSGVILVAVDETDNREGQ